MCKRLQHSHHSTTDTFWSFRLSDSLISCMCSAFLSAAIQYNSETDYSDEELDVNDSDDDADSICSGSTLSGDGQDSLMSDLLEPGFDDVYSDGQWLPLICQKKEA